MNSTMYSCDKARKIFLLLYMYFFIEYCATKFSFFFFLIGNELRELSRADSRAIKVTSN